MLRVHVTMDDHGNVLQCGYDHEDHDGPTSIWTTTYGPFDTPTECFESALADARRYIGVQASLF
jgi:hypothetical protein